MTIHDYFPGINELVAVVRAWPRVFARPPGDSQPIAFEEGRVVVLCVGDDPLRLVRENTGALVGLLNRVLDGDVLVTAITAIEGTQSELYLARDLLAMKSWLVDYDVGI